MSYFPDRRSGIDPPGIADALSESLSNQYGNWSSLYGDIVRLDAHAAVGNYAVRAVSVAGGVIEQGSLVFTLSTVLNLTNFEKFQFMIAAVVGTVNDNLTGTAHIYLSSGSDSLNPAWAQADFEFAKGQASQPVSYSTKTFVQTDFTIHQFGIPFDWTNITRIELFFDTKNLNPYTWDGYTIFIDGGPFFLLSSVPSKLAVLAEDVNGSTIGFGKHMQLISPTGATSSENVPWGPFAISPAGTWTVTILDDDFVQWKDGVTDRTRNILINVGQAVTVVAVFQSGQPPPPSTGSNLIVAGVAGISLIAIVIYYLSRGTKR